MPKPVTKKGPTRSVTSKTTFDQFVPVNSQYLSKVDVEDEPTVTIASFTYESVKSDDGEEEKGIVYFEEVEKGLILNRTNTQSIATISQAETLEEAVGTKLILYYDRTISFGGRAVGGIRIREAHSKAKPTKTTRRIGKR